MHLAKKENIETIVDFGGAQVGNRNAVIFMEYMREGTLQQHIKRQREILPNGAWPVIAEEKWRVFVRDIFTALAFLYSKGLFHGDIKGENMLVYADGSRLKLADFGSAGEIQNTDAVSEDGWRTASVALEMLNGAIPPIFCVGGPLRQKFVEAGKHLPPEASEETKRLLNFLFGAEQGRLPNPAEVLDFLNAELD